MIAKFIESVAVCVPLRYIRTSRNHEYHWRTGQAAVPTIHTELSRRDEQVYKIDRQLLKFAIDEIFSPMSQQCFVLAIRNNLQMLNCFVNVPARDVLCIPNDI